MTSSRYVCRCKCGRTFSSVYPTTVLCRVCVAHFIYAIEDSHDQDYSHDEGYGDAYDGFDSPAIDTPKVPQQKITEQTLLAGVLDSLSRKTGRWQPVAVLVMIAVVIALGFVLTAAQADAQGWGQ